ncbi:MAG: hypothetical protein AB7S97_06330, partial [Thermoplasmata archaeon]
MSSQSLNEDTAKDASPAESDLPDLYLLLSARSHATGKIAFWLGIAIFLWLILGAYQTSEDASFPAELSATWHDWVWTGLAGIGIIVSFSVCSFMISLRKPGDPPYDALAAIGGAVSIVVVVIALLESVGALNSLISSDGGVLWPDAKPLWFLPLSSVGVILPMVALILARKDDIRDEVLGLFLSCGPLIVLSLPFLLGLDEAGIIRWIPTIYLVAGLSLMFAGFRPFSRSANITLESMEHMSSRALAAILVVVSVLCRHYVSADEALSSSMDAIWIMPLIVSLILSVALLVAVNNAPAGTVAWSRDPSAPGRHRALVAFMVMSFATVASSVALLSLFVLGYLDALSFPDEHALY